MKNKKSYCGNHIAMRDNVSNMKIYVVMGPYLNGGSRAVNLQSHDSLCQLSKCVINDPIHPLPGMDNSIF
jgi:hypothetical protein